jgi:hypothetical protein
MLHCCSRLPWFISVLSGCLLLAPAVIGCGRAQPKLAPVSGRVTVQGKPLANVNVTFQPTAKAGSGAEAGMGSSGTTDGSGRFQMKTFDNKPGAVIGTQVVGLAVKNAQARDSDVWGAAKTASPLPPRASDGSLKFEVPPGGTDKANFDF